MARFLKVHAQVTGHHTPSDKQEYAYRDRWLNVYNIDEITGKATTDGMTTAIYMHYSGSLGHHTNKPEAAQYIVAGNPEDWVAKIDAIIAADIAAHHPVPAPAEPLEGVFTTSWEDTWTPGKKYAAWDVVAHPDNHARRFLALKPSSSTSVLVLANESYWCELPASTA